MSAVDHEAAMTKLLVDLGEYADAIADQMRAKGIKGIVGNACACPIARLLEREGYFEPIVNGEIYAEREGEPVEIAFPTQAIQDFIQRFDDGVYLDLVEAS